MIQKDFKQSVWDAACAVPAGKLATYGGIAKAIGAARASRAVGAVLCKAPAEMDVPYHRIVYADGRLGCKSHKRLKELRAEGIEVKNKRVQNLQQYLYEF